MNSENCTKNPGTYEIPEQLVGKLERLGIIDRSGVRDYNIGKSDYAKHIIQPWAIWIEYELDPWEADIVKRILREKNEPGFSSIESRIMDFQKIIHIATEKIRQLKLEQVNEIH